MPSEKKQISRSFGNFVELLDDPAIIVDKKLNILYRNVLAKVYLEKKSCLDIANLKSLSCMANLIDSQNFSLSKSNLEITIDSGTSFRIKPLRSKDLYLVYIRQEVGQEPIRRHEIDWDPMAEIVHDMRTPLSAIIGFTRMLADNNVGDLEKKVFLDRAEDNLTYLQEIISELLQFSKQQHDTIKVEKRIIDSKDFLEGLCHNLEVVAKNRGLGCQWTLNQDIPQKIALDASGLRHVVDNLVGNAIKYTQKGSIELSFDYDFDRGLLKFRVRDSGIGIDPENQDKIFLPFFQESKRDRGGVGLGLSIIKVYSKAMGGDAYLVESYKGQGSVFGAHFDCSITGELEESEIHTLSDLKPTINPLTLQGAKILIVDDSPDIQMLVKKIFTILGAEVMTTDSPINALEYLKIGKIDLLVSDIQMPEMTGHELLDNARDNGFNGAAIALTGLEEQKAVESCGQHQFSCYLTKPFRFDVLRAMAAELVQVADTTSDMD